MYPEGSPISTEARTAELDSLHDAVRTCTACQLHENRTHAVPGEGPVNAPIMLVGEGPGAEEDATGRPFCGRAGEVLDDLLTNAGLDRNVMYITSTVKCRPPNNRNPHRGEAEVCCSTWLEKQVELVSPSIVVLLGKVAMRYVIGETDALKDCHGQVRQQGGRRFMMTYHPAAALRFNAALERAQEDFKKAGDLAGLT